MTWPLPGPLPQPPFRRSTGMHCMTFCSGMLTLRHPSLPLHYEGCVQPSLSFNSRSGSFVPPSPSSLLHWLLPWSLLPCAWTLCPQSLFTGSERTRPLPFAFVSCALSQRGSYVAPHCTGTASLDFHSAHHCQSHGQIRRQS